MKLIGLVKGAIVSLYQSGATTFARATKIGAKKGPARPIPLTYDPLFEAYGGLIPVAFLRVLAYSESRLNPNSEVDKGINVDTRRLPPTEKDPKGKQDSYWGLFQVGIKNVLTDFNKVNNLNLTPKQLFDPTLNTRIACWHLNRQVKAYRANFPGIRNIGVIDWTNPEFVKLVLAGWNSGHSMTSGVQGVAKWLIDHGHAVTHDHVFQFAGQVPKATKHLDGNLPNATKKRIWQVGVAKRYFTEVKLDQATPPDEGPGPLLSGNETTLPLLLLAGGLFLALLRISVV
jgi:hypothetical protein